MFGIGSALRKVGGHLVNPVVGQFSFLAGKAIPSVRGLSASERKALNDAKLAEDDYRKRTLETMRRRSRVALGVQGGQRSLLFGGFTGTGA